MRGGSIESRRTVTDRAIVEAACARRPERVLDVGCGEGWLVRRLASEGIQAVGVDASVPLVEAARAAHPEAACPAEYHVSDYAGLVGDPLRFGRFDAVVCNFALLDEDVVALLGACGAALAPGGAVLVQTVHPWTGCEERYADGWRVERFEAFGPDFTEPMPWFFRTLGSWLHAFRAAGLAVTSLGEPGDPGTGRPLSLLLEGEPGSRR